MMMMMVIAIQITNMLKCLVGAIKLTSRRGDGKVKLKHKMQTSYEMNESKMLKTANTR
jgi:hypothetical protein